MSNGWTDPFFSIVLFFSLLRVPDGSDVDGGTKPASLPEMTPKQPDRIAYLRG
jgi:hypothetical protein